MLLLQPLLLPYWYYGGGSWCCTFSFNYRIRVRRVWLWPRIACWLLLRLWISGFIVFAHFFGLFKGLLSSPFLMVGSEDGVDGCSRGELGLVGGGDASLGFSFSLIYHMLFKIFFNKDFRKQSLRLAFFLPHPLQGFLGCLQYSIAS